MVDNQHQKISGYRDLSEQEIHSMNLIKSLEAGCAALHHEMLDDTGAGYDGRCLAVARTKLQEAFMWWVRSVAKPESPFD